MRIPVTKVQSRGQPDISIVFAGEMTSEQDILIYCAYISEVSDAKDGYALIAALKTYQDGLHRQEIISDLSNNSNDLQGSNTLNTDLFLIPERVKVAQALEYLTEHPDIVESWDGYVPKLLG